MDGFKTLPKIQHFKEGGSIQRQVHNFTKRDRKSVEEADTKQDKKIVKKAFGMHDSQQHDEKTDLSGLKKGGRAKKEKGTVKKFKVGGSVDNEYSNKKSSGDLDNIAKVKDIKPGKATATSKAAVKPNFKGSDVEKEKSKPAGEKDFIKKVKPTGDKKADALSGAKGPDAYKKGGKIKKMADGSLTGALAGGALGGGLSGMIQDQQRKKRIAQMLSPSQQAELAAQQEQATNQYGPGAQAASQVQPAGGTSPAGAVPMQKRGGKVKKMNTGGTCP
jgi:hypothetical protein